MTAGDAAPAAVAEAPTAASADGPFGLSAGMQLRELDVVDEATGPGRQVLGAVPRPMPDIEQIVATVAPDAGLCALEGRSRALPTTADGADLRDAFGAMEAALDRRWGAQHRTNIRFSRAAPDAEQTWMQSLLAGQRTLASAWMGAAQAPLTPDLDRVTLTAVADAADRGSLRIEYRFPNHADCMAELLADSAPDPTED